MTCPRREEVERLAVGDLDPAAVVGLKRHLEDCAACREHEEGLRLSWELLDGAPRIAAPADFAERVLARARAEARKGGRLVRLAPWLGVAAAAVLGVAVALSKHRTPTPDPDREVVENLSLLLNQPALERDPLLLVDAPGSNGSHEDYGY
jgi:hypothetical protein